MFSIDLVLKSLTAQQIYEFTLTFGSEITLMWNAPWTIPKVLFLLSRYWSSVTLAILLYRTTLFDMYKVGYSQLC